MDKNMIDIDDLIKQRLSGGEEREMPGSWTRMRELLDKEMPERRVTGFAWRRMLGVMSGLVLLSLVTVGSYTVIHSMRSNKPGGGSTGAAIEKGAVAHSSAAKTERLNPLNTVDKASDIAEGNGIALSKAKAYTGSVSKKAAANTGKTTTSANISKVRATKSSNYNDRIASIDRIQHKSLESRTHHLPVAKLEPVTALTQLYPTQEDKTASANEDTKTEVNAQKAVPKAKIASANNSNSSNATHKNNITSDNSQLKTVSSKGLTPALNVPDKIEPLRETSAAVADNTKLTTTPAPKQPALPKDSMKKMTVIQRYVINPITRTGRLTLDTVSFGKMAVDRHTLAAMSGTTSESANTDAITPMSATAPSLAANMNAELSGSAVMVPLSNLKVKSKKTNRWNTRTFDEVVRDVKFNMSQTRFYPGVSGGINSYLFGPSNLGGIQLGLFGLFTFGETWSAMAELKYVHRFNNGSTFEDNYMNIKRNGGNSYLQNEVKHFFKFSSLQSIEMPLALRYAAGRLNLFGGVNLAYNLAINAEESWSTADSTYTPTSNPQWTNSKPTLTYSDFAARFSIGGLAGVSWELSPSFQVDFRATKNFWDNATGGGATKVSQELYSPPSFQMSLFYRLNQKNQIPRAK